MYHRIHPDTSYKSDTHQIPYSDNLFVRSADHRSEIVTKKEHSYITRTNFSFIAEQLSTDSRYLLLIRGILVNMDYIRDVEEEFVLADNSRIPIRVRGRKQVLEEYDQYFHEDCAQKRAENAREKKKEKRML